MDRMNPLSLSFPALRTCTQFYSKLQTPLNMSMDEIVGEMDSRDKADSILINHLNSELGPMDKQWRLFIEKETILIILKGYIDDLKIRSKSSNDFSVSKNQKLKTADGNGNKDALIARLMEERRESTLQTMAMDEHYMVLVNECCDEFAGYEIETKVKEDMFIYVLHEVAKDWSVYEESERIKMQLKDEIYNTVFLETVNDIRIKLDFELLKIENKISEHCIQNTIRLEPIKFRVVMLVQIKQQVKSILEIEASVKKEELVYKKAFARRCQNLLLAETEVDLLGDQVEALQDLLGKIYYVLVKNCSVLLHDGELNSITLGLNSYPNGQSEIEVHKRTDLGPVLKKDRDRTGLLRDWTEKRPVSKKTGPKKDRQIPFETGLKKDRAISRLVQKRPDRSETGPKQCHY
ncbi:hypothetical protein LXL04_022034 [Taraxacum kok-saghyz]